MARGLHGSSWSSPTRTPGWKTAVASTLLGASWQRCRIHFRAHPALGTAGTVPSEVRVVGVMACAMVHRDGVPLINGARGVHQVHRAPTGASSCGR